MSGPLADERWWDTKTVAIVTGANKGIGLEISKILHREGLTTVMTARNEDLGKASQAEVSGSEGSGPVLFHPLDISDQGSVSAFASWAKEQFPGGIDILVNNAGIAFKGNTFGPEEAQTTLSTNFHGTMMITEALLPLIKDKVGRVVVVSSRAGKAERIPSAELRQKILGASNAELTALADKFVSDVSAGKHSEEGWSNSMYGISKLLLSMYTKNLAKELEPRKIMVNACCPGWCKTDMSSNQGPKPAADGADTPCWLALRPPSQFLTGGFWGEREEQGW